MSANEGILSMVILFLNIILKSFREIAVFRSKQEKYKMSLEILLCQTGNAPKKNTVMSKRHRNKLKGLLMAKPMTIWATMTEAHFSPTIT